MPAPPPRGPGPGEVGLRLLKNATGALRDALLYPLEARVPREWVVIRLDRGLVEASAQSAWLDDWMQRPRALSAALETLARASADPDVAGVLLRVGQASLGWATVAALSRACAALRAQQKKLVVYGETTGNAGAWLGAQADHFWLAPGGRVDLLGIRMETPFVRRLLERLGVRPEVLAAGRYKSAGELLVRDSMSEPAREALEAVVEVLWDSLARGLAEGRARDLERARRWIDDGPYLAGEAHELGLVDALVYPDELAGRLAKLGGRSRDEANGEARTIGDAAYLRVSRDRFRWRPLLQGTPQLAVVPVLGLLRHGAGSTRYAVESLLRLEKQRDVRAAVLRINSPGGDPLAADLIWHAAKRLSESKPVVASMGDAAASGGYYVAAAANEIIAESTTLTGSIGVVLASLEFEPLLERLGVRMEAIERGRHAGIYDPTKPRSAGERALLKRQVERLYLDFVDKAAAGRGIARKELEPNAQGRVWTGSQAHERGLVDALGGVDTALARARSLAGLGPDEGEPLYLPSSPHPLARVRGGEPLHAALALGEPLVLCPVEVPLR